VQHSRFVLGWDAEQAHDHAERVVEGEVLDDVNGLLACDEAVDGVSRELTDGRFPLADVRRHEPRCRDVLDLGVLGRVHVGEGVLGSLVAVGGPHVLAAGLVQQEWVCHGAGEDLRGLLDLQDVGVPGRKPRPVVSLDLGETERPILPQPGHCGVGDVLFVRVGTGEHDGLCEVVRYTRGSGQIRHR
jgi:hypothetical protein